ncbi:MAG: hypothetical protein LUF02_08430 [Erysipelotrichaceae bacterium]|nr:hypothetical protein [Erysipelotrichaceae bacterium]
MKYQLQIINYKPYEYQLLQEKLNQLGNDGYYCNDLAFISVFKKTNHKVYYKIDFFSMTGKTRNDKMNSRQKLFDKYLDENYQPIYAKKGMYVFVGDHLINTDYMHKSILNKSKKTKYEGLFTAALLGSVLFVYFLSINLRINALLSYGIVFFYLGLIMLCIIFMFRTYFNKEYIKKLDKQLLSDYIDMPQERIKTLRKIYLVLVIICTLFIGGGLTEDFINGKSFNQQQHAFLTLSDLNIDTSSELTTQKYSGFIAKNSYISLEVADEDQILYIKEYQFNQSSFADEYIYEVTSDEEDYQSDNNVIYVYEDSELSLLLIRNENTVTYVSFGFIPTDDQIATTIDFYQ